MISKSTVKTNIFLTILSTIVLPIVLGNILNNSFSIKYISIPLHSGLEVSGGVIAIVISIIFYIKYLKNNIFTHFNYTTIALLAMGIIDIFHGIVMPGKLFVWLHSTAVFFGGILFMSIWLKDKKVSKTTYKLIPLFTVIFAVFFSVFSILFPNIVPEMLNEDKTFSNFANLLNIAGGIGFFVASTKFIKEYINTKNIEELLFAGHTMLFGIAGLLFVSSVVWDMQWWLWHFLRLFAYMIALYFLYVEFDREIKFIESTNKKLDIANRKINKYLEIVDKNVITSSTDLKGNITNVSEAFCRISGYTKDELIGKKHNIIKNPEMPSSLYKDLWSTISQNISWHGEIKNRRKDGSSYWISATISPVFNDEGEKIGYTAIRHDISDKKKIELISITDGLTNIYNRRHFDNIFPKVINSAKRKNELVAFLIMDIDHFKQYNDIYGHQMGDNTLIKVADTIKNSLHRADDYCFRLGGEEFGVIFKADTTEKAVSFANTIKTNIENLHIKHMGNSASSYVTTSIGLICKNANDIVDQEELYKQSDELLYRAKESGRNQVASNT